MLMVTLAFTCLSSDETTKKQLSLKIGVMSRGSRLIFGGTLSLINPYDKQHFDIFSRTATNHQPVNQSLPAMCLI